MIYKNYEAQISYSEDDEIFVGRVVNVEFDMIAFDGTSITELKTAFKSAVDDYLQDCSDINKLPETPLLQKVTA
jgi:predicted HicB family RNase H-like nuclease